MALFTSVKKAKKRAKSFAAGQAALGAAGVEAIDTERARTQAAEATRSNVYGLLGAPGTYDLPGAPGAGGQGQQGITGGIFATGGELVQRSEAALGAVKGVGSKKRAGLTGTRTGILDPEAAAADIAGTAGFRIQSFQVAESEQLLNQKGPIWDMLHNSTIGIISEGAARGLRDDLRLLRNRAAKGGTARRTALNEMNQMLAVERNNRMRVQETWSANLALFNTIRANADRVRDGTQSFLDGLPQIRDAYNQSMGTLGRMMAEIAIPKASKALEVGYVRTEETMQKKSFFTGLLEGAIVAVAAAGLEAIAPGAGGFMMQATGQSDVGGGDPTGGLIGKAGAWAKGKMGGGSTTGSSTTGTGSGSPGWDVDYGKQGANPNEWNVDYG